ncbi:MAG: F0F1 ATP synthase subunit A [Elusimicrobia bacterium]|nr:F0F1 ATP synthase subunit A [Elusimicrobiota bacterium]MDE2426726.1 F0F1 ATP synthase subunit A [Elusimicrobiota bacterium]
MNFEEILAHHIINRYSSNLYVHGINFGLSSHLITMWIVAGLVALLMIYAARSSSAAGRVLRGGVEAIVIYMRDDMLHPIFHEDAEAYLPYFLTLFFFIFAANLVGLVPRASAVMSNPNVTGGLALCTFALIHLAGCKAQGPIQYLKHIVPPGLPLLLVPLLFVIEFLGIVAKCLALCIRLFANILSGHVVSLAFLSLIFIFAQMSRPVGLLVSPMAVGLALFAYLLDVLVAVLQAYIFTILTAVFVGGAVHPH